LSRSEHGADEGGSLLASGVRLVMRPARALAGSVGGAAAAERTVDEILAGPLPEIIGRSIGEHRVIERIVAEASATDDFARSLVTALEHERTQKALRDVLASPAVKRLLEDALRSPEFGQLLGQVFSSPQVRNALTEQSSSLALEAAVGARARAVRLDAKLERGPRRLFRKQPTAAFSPTFGGFASRGFALGIDAFLVAVVFLVGSALIGLVAQLVGHLKPEWLVGVLLGSGYLLVSIVYFVGFWTTAGQTPGMRLMRLRVVTSANAPLGFWRSLVRLVGLALAIIPCFAGFLPALVDDRRRALQDFLAGTLVVYDEQGTND
jgi:uncharacterized RDD family membrane protein YckC